MKAHRDALYPDLRALWEANGDKTAGTWAEVFGDIEGADEIFMAWQYARFAHAVAAKGKAAYNIPMYVNTWLDERRYVAGRISQRRPRAVGCGCLEGRRAGFGFLFAGPLRRQLRRVGKRYHRDGNPLYMPEARGGAEGAANVFYALGEEAGLGFSPFGIEDELDEKGDLAASYHAIAGLAPLLLKHQGAGDVHGFVLDKSHPSVDFTMSGYAVHVSWTRSSAVTRGERLRADHGQRTGCSFWARARASGCRSCRAAAQGQQVGIAAVDEGTFEDGKWVPGRRLNGDENDQGKGWRFDSRQLRTEKVTLYRFD